MTAWHVAPVELRDLIAEEGLDPTGERAVLLLPETPAEPFEGFDLWEVDADVPPGAASFCPERIGPDRLRLLLPEVAPGM